MTFALIATLHLLAAVSLQAPPPAPKPVPAPTTQKPAQPGTTAKKPAAASTATTVATVTVTDSSGAPIHDVRVLLSGGVVDRSGSTQPNGTVKFDGLRAATYRLRFNKDGFVPLEREFEWRGGQPPPALSVVLSAAAAAPPPPPAPEPAAQSAAMPPPGQPVSLSLPDFIEKNYIGNSQPQKVTAVGCSGLAQNSLWQIREPWENRQHSGADAMIYVIGGDGTLRLGGRDIPMQAGHFASVPRGTSYSLLRRGRNPLIVLATLVGEPCQ
jgi:mannose-6-phosphate isomerase-like protein (cupin superfamily)